MTSTLDHDFRLDVASGTEWTAVCRVDDIQPERAVCAVVGGRQVAIVRTFDDELYAVSQRDPVSGAFVLSRGIVGTRRVDDTEVPVLQSPLFKDAFDLRSGRCLTQPDTSVPVYAVRTRAGVVEVGALLEAGHDR